MPIMDDALAADYELTEEYLRAIDDGLEDAGAGRLVSDEDTKALYDRFRSA